MNRDRLIESAALVALVRRGDRYWHRQAQLAELNGSALAVLEGKFEDPGPPVATGQLFEDPQTSQPIDLEPIIDEILGWEQDGTTLLTILDDAYPSNLRSIHNRPPFLFVRGALSREDERAIAIVGTRNASDEGVRNATEIAIAASAHSFTVFSGLARGIDTAAHKAALDAGSRTVAVIGTGVNRYYPAENRQLQDEIANRFALVSQFWPDSPPTRQSFPMRNAVMSGLSLATVVVEASGKSGARMQARLALEHGRPVFLLRSLLVHSWAQDYAERAGTTVVDDIDQIFEKLLRLESLEPAFA